MTWWVYIAKLIYTYNVGGVFETFDEQVGNSSRMLGSTAKVMGQHQQNAEKKRLLFAADLVQMLASTTTCYWSSGFKHVIFNAYLARCANLIHIW